MLMIVPPLSVNIFQDLTKYFLPPLAKQAGEGQEGGIPLEKFKMWPFNGQLQKTPSPTLCVGEG